MDAGGRPNPLTMFVKVARGFAWRQRFGVRRVIRQSGALTTKCAASLLTAGMSHDMVLYDRRSAVATRGRVMSLLAVLMLFLQPSTDTAAINPGGIVQPQSGGIPTTPPPKPPTQPY